MAGQLPPSIAAVGGLGGPAAPPPQPRREDLWSQYRIHVELYKHYLDLTLKVNVFYYAITGAIVSFYLSRQQPGPLKHALLLPIVMGTALAILGGFGAWRNEAVVQDVRRIVGSLGLTTWPDMRVLSFLLAISVLLLLIVAAGLVYLVYEGDQFFPSRGPKGGAG